MVAKQTTPDMTSQDWASWRANLDAAHVNAERIALAFLAQAQDTPNMTVRILAGALRIADVLTEVAAQNTGTITAPVGNPRIDRVVLNLATGAAEVLTGTPAGSPVAPAIPADRLPICRFQLSPSTTAIANSMIVDERVIAGGGSSNAGAATITAGEALANRDLIYLDVFNQRGGGADRWYKVDTDALSPVRISPYVGFALAAIASGASGSAQVRSGRVAGFSGLTVGGLVFASATPGAITQTIPPIPASGSQNVSRRVGYAASATEIEFEPHGSTFFTGRVTAMAVDGTFTVQHWPDSGERDRDAYAYGVQITATAVVPGATGTNIGTLTAGGGLAAAFDGNASKTGAVCAALLSVTSAYIGKTYSPAKPIASVSISGSSDGGYLSVIAPNVTIVLRGKNGAAPSSRTDGTSLGSITFVDQVPETAARTIVSNSGASWDHVFLDISHDGAANNMTVAQIVFTEITGVARDEQLTIGGSATNAGATDKVNVRFDDGAGANSDTRTTFINRTGAARDIVVEAEL